MRKRRLLAGCVGLVLALLFPAVASAQDTAVDSRWASVLPSVDGQAEEWPPDTLSLQKKLKIDFGFKNDSRNLFILMVFKDPKSLSSIDATGITISCSPLAAKQRTNTVLFIGKTLTADEYITRIESSGTPLTEKEKEVLRIRQQHPVFDAYAVDDQGKTVAPRAPRSDVDPPAFKAAWRGKIATFEFRVPLAPPAVHPAGIGAVPGDTIQVSFEWGGKSTRLVKARANWPTPAAAASSGAYNENDESRAQVFLMGFDAMSSPSIGTKKHAFRAVVRLAPGR
jgi:hypothetical protein